MFAGVIALFSASAASAADFAGEVGAEVTKDNLGDYVASSTADLSFGQKFSNFTALGSIGLAVDKDDAEIDTWSLGASFGATSVSFGDQEDLFSFGGLEVVGGETLADPADDHESLIVGYGDVDVLVGFTDITNDIGEIENVQLAYSTKVAVASVAGAVDYNLNTEAYILAVAVDADVNDTIGAGATLTYDNAASVLAYEAVGRYAALDALAVSAFVNGDDADMAQNIGAGAVYTKDKLGAFAEVGYNLNTEEFTPAVGVSFNF